jgi:hypothetical protein
METGHGYIALQLAEYFSILIVSERLVYSLLALTSSDQVLYLVEYFLKDFCCCYVI